MALPDPPEEEAKPALPDRIGPFEITGVLGEGGSATVYAATHEGRDCALKVPKDRELSAKDQERFLEEAKMLQRVRHRAVIQVLDSGRLPDGQPYLLMRRYEGETLADHIRRLGRIPLERALDLFEQLGGATTALHEAGLVHRDLKPENVLLVDEGRTLKLLDFGIAKDLSSPASTTTQLGIARGTPANMAPERFFGAAASESTDIYELGVVLYTMLAGRLPWPEVTNPNARLNPVSPEDAGVSLPEALSTALMQALSTRTEQRPRKVSEFVESVKRAAKTSPRTGPRVTAETSVHPPPLTPHRSEEAQVIESVRPKRSLWPWMISAALFVALVAAVIVGVGLATRPVPEVEETLGASAPPSPSLTLAPPSAVLVVAEPEPSATAPSTRPHFPSRAHPPCGEPAGGSCRATRPHPSQSGPAPSAPPPSKGKPRGAPCTRSSECASMVCAAETCQ